MDSCLVMKMGSAIRRKEILLQRPKFYPCPACGRKFTQRALEIHQISCSEREDCSCIACNITKQGVWDGDDLEEECSFELRINGSSSCGNSEKVRHEDHTDQLLVKKTKDDSKVESLESRKIDDPPADMEVLANSENKYVLLWSDTAAHQRAVNIKLHASTEDHEGDACNRKLFCCVCKEHVFWESYGLHVLQHCKVTENKYVTCPECSTTYSKPTLFLIHFYIHVSTHPLDCPECRCSYPKCIDATNRAIVEHCYAESAPFHCYICLKHFGHCQTVVNHMRLHSKEMPFVCKECNRSFRQIGNLQRHMTTHRGERPHKCPNCFRSFADPATLRNHVRVHTGETPYVCNICKRGFSQVGNLKRHMALHLQRDDSTSKISKKLDASPEDPDPVVENGKSDSDSEKAKSDVEKKLSDTTSSNITTKVKHLNNIFHKQRVRKKNGKIRVFPCPTCGKVYTWQHDLTIHFRTHTGEKPFKCEFCEKRFAQSGAVNIHKARHHSDKG
ncbi:gastrula zinc finger protein XlCGF57.1-like [Uloborus diversus]|uniref:gastrula zinc finger protein XlCGF57.1-like n=1 Tax=Uloborus diversus TaxID=327109 RepID=UPI002409A3DC|nr:gastrula zinc finger protein XlCGF57.1-like [Uloborus diversus]